jgi:hypothetical protein
MNKIAVLHKPLWRPSGADWHLMIGNRSVAKITPNFCVILPHYKWLSVLARDYADSPWHAVDFRTLAIAKHDIEQWWLHFCRGEAYRTDSVALGEALR